MIEVSEIYVDVSDVYVLCPHCHERQGYWYEDPKGASTVCDQCENDFSVSAAAELQMEGTNSSTNHSLVEKLQADYAAQGLALKAAKAMQAGETERADRAERALLRAGWTHAAGCAEWKPPLGPSAYPLLEKIDNLMAELELESAIAAVKGGAA
ncbi:hypothetical protein [Chromobacterium rhizoryzae]|uniref:Uncharacterized protein n=1 Tax=Chromobacterium rhizoryzae TaxID=1778675 RepID=A0AAD0RS58_9NEIS|nr:hypothetical protein [Chromobacterium rhizoryzae]AXT46395.1 hypothetical protein D1345_09435 [Chromobacterium rhizoryzae]